MTDRDDADRPRVVRKLEDRLNVARQLRALEKDPVLEVVDIEKLRRSVARLFWVFLSMGLAYTTVGVQDFLAGHLTPADPMWWGAWFVEPCLAGVLLNLMRWEAAMIARDIAIDSGAVSWLKRILLGATLVMNMVPALWPRSGEVAFGEVFAHGMVPLVVFFLAEVMPIAQARCAQAKTKAATAVPAVTNHPVAPAPGPARPSVPAPTPEGPEPANDPISALRLPAGLGDQLRRHVDQLRAANRPVTPEAITEAVRIPAPLAHRLVADLSRLNGSPAPA